MILKIVPVSLNLCDFPIWEDHLTMGSFHLNPFRIERGLPSEREDGRDVYLAPAIQTLGIVPGCPVLGSNEQIVDGGEHDW